MGTDGAITVMTPYREPEALFRLGPMTVGDGSARAVMHTGPWLADADGRPMAGSLSVPVDDVLGQALLTAADVGGWPVTTELSFDLASPLEIDSGDLEVVAEALHVDAVGGLSRGEVRTSGGRVHAVAILRASFIPDVPGPEQLRSIAVDAESLPSPSTIVEIGADRCVLPDLPLVANTRGVVHGGMLAFAAERAARAVAPPALWTTSLRIFYLRPAIAPVDLVARVVHAGRSLAAVEVTATRADGRVCGTATVGFRAWVRDGPRTAH